MADEKVAKSFGTHDGSFHADEVTACALLLLFDCIEREKVIRTRDLEILSRCDYVCDVGGIYDPTKRLFDHHQVDYQGEHSSAGMVLEYLLSQKIIDSNVYHFLLNSLIIGVDDHDNGRDPQRVGYCSFSNLISNFTPIEYDASSEELDQAFFEAVALTKWHLERLLKRYSYVRSCRKQVEEAMKQKSLCLFFEKGIPWLDSFFDLGGLKHPALFVIMPSGNHWKLRGIPPSYEERMKVRHPLPQEWAGLLDTDLKRISGIPGAIFCHKGRFISVWETKKDALLALDYILKKVGESV